MVKILRFGSLRLGMIDWNRVKHGRALSLQANNSHLSVFICGPIVANREIRVRMSLSTDSRSSPITPSTEYHRLRPERIRGDTGPALVELRLATRPTNILPDAHALKAWCKRVWAAPRPPQRIVGGSVTTIAHYPYAVVLLFSSNLITYRHSCGGTILTTTTILSAAHCTIGDPVERWNGRVGSTYAHSGGTVHSFRLIINHPNYSSWTFDNDIGILRTQNSIVYINNAVGPAIIAGNSYNLADNQEVGGSPSEELRHVKIWTVNQNTCSQRYAELGATITDNMLCSGWLDVGGRDQCQGDSGGPLIHSGVIVGVCSWGYQCALPHFPGVNARVSRYAIWIQQQAALE
ncbi:Trypsin CFT-1 [Eumeta japonica]|uniref:Trypsin CFT-1 n=1 Tax=Eumeta variegata TaxID=151549 RepID=A0A4C1WHH1_EUMVA|nr:Trypsin CFT-1 [Eumeta japonica]